jgi:hypothetical protein
VGVTLTDGDGCGLVLPLGLADEEGFCDGPADGLPVLSACPGFGAVPCLPVGGLLTCLPPGLVEPLAAGWVELDPPAVCLPSCEEVSACVVCVCE